MAFTSGIPNAGSDSAHRIEIVHSDGTARNLQFYNRPGNDKYRHKGDLWTFSFSDFHFNDPCITLSEIRSVAITDSGNDGWHIKSIVTLVTDFNGGAQLLTHNMNANRWVDGNGHSSRRRFQLSLSN